MLSGAGVRTVAGEIPQFSPLSGDIAIAEKFVVHPPGLSHCLMDMKLTYWVLPTEMPAVGMIPVSVGASLMLLMICLERPGAHTGEPEYLLETTPFGTLVVWDRARSWLRNSVLYRHCRPRTLQ